MADINDRLDRLHRREEFDRNGMPLRPDGTGVTRPAGVDDRLGEVLDAVAAVVRRHPGLSVMVAVADGRAGRPVVRVTERDGSVETGVVVVGSAAGAAAPTAAGQTAAVPTTYTTDTHPVDARAFDGTTIEGRAVEPRSTGMFQPRTPTDPVDPDPYEPEHDAGLREATTRDAGWETPFRGTGPREAWAGAGSWAGAGGRDRDDSWAGDADAERDRAEQVRAGQVRAGQVRAEQARAVPVRADPVGADRGRPGQQPDEAPATAGQPGTGPSGAGRSGEGQPGEGQPGEAWSREARAGDGRHAARTEGTPVGAGWSGSSWHDSLWSAGAQSRFRAEAGEAEHRRADPAGDTDRLRLVPDEPPAPPAPPGGTIPLPEDTSQVVSRLAQLLRDNPTLASSWSREAPE